MNIIITGIAGFIGHSLARRLISNGHRVLGIDSMADDYPVELKWARVNDLCSHSVGAPGSFDMSYRDIDTDGVVIPSHMGDYIPDVVYHLAGRAGIRDSLRCPREYVDSNIGSTLAVLDLCSKYHARYIFASTVSAYGEDGHLLSTYAITKLAAEMMGYLYSDQFPITNFRFDTVYGPWGRPDMAVMKFIHSIHHGREVNVYGDGRQTRAFVYVDDIIDSCISCMGNVGYNELYLGNTVQVSVNGLVAIVEEVIGRRATVRYMDRNPADVLTSPALNTDITRVTDIVTGIHRTYEWYLDHIGLMDSVFGGSYEHTI